MNIYQPFKVISFSFVIMSLLIFPAASADKSELETAYERCQQKFPGNPLGNKFSGLRSVGLYVNHIGNYEKAVLCHKNEEACVDKSLTSEQQLQNKEYYNELYNSYPSPVRFENLVSTFSEQIRYRILPFLIPNEGCQVPDVRVFRTEDDVWYLDEFVKREDALTVVVALDIVGPRPNDDSVVLKTGFAKISVKLYRNGLPEEWKEIYQRWKPEVFLPLDLSEAQMTAAIQKIAFSVAAPRNVHAVRWPGDGDPMEIDFISPEEAVREQEEARKARLPPNMIPIADVSPWKQKSK